MAAATPYQESSPVVALLKIRYLYNTEKAPPQTSADRESNVKNDHLCRTHYSPL